MNKWIHETDLENYPEISREETVSALNLCVRRTLQNMRSFKDGFPAPASKDNFYSPGPNLGWTSGFYTGLVWLSFENTSGDLQQELLTGALKQVSSFLARIQQHRDVDHHDMGFLYSPSCVAAFKLTGSAQGRTAAVLAADQLILRFQEKGEFLQAWGAMGAADNYRFIVDCLLNLPLLYWASEETGDPKYREIAGKHLRTAMQYVIRENGSCYHTVFMDPETGAFHHGATCQGYRDGSAWARGQAWGVYGCAIAYRYTREACYIDSFRRVTSYFLSHLPCDLIPYWDLEFGNGDGLSFDDPRLKDCEPDLYESGSGIEPRDSSAAVIAICGLLEMARHLGKTEAAYYAGIARKLLKAVLDTCFAADDTKTNGLLLHGTYSHKSPFNTCSPYGTDECVIWGDYYFFEALHRIVHPDWNTYW